MWTLTSWYNRDLRYINAKKSGCSSFSLYLQEYSRCQKEHSKEIYIFYAVIIQNIIKWLIIKFPQAVTGVLILWIDTLKHCYSIINSLKKSICYLASVCTLLPLSPCACKFPGFERSFPFFWQSTAHPFLKTKLKNPPNRGHSWINSTPNTLTIFSLCFPLKLDVLPILW